MGTVRAPVDWVTADHAAEYPDHFRVCGYCRRTFDASVDRTTGKHRSRGGRRALTCSERCDNLVQRDRRHLRAGTYKARDVSGRRRRFAPLAPEASTAERYALERVQRDVIAGERLRGITAEDPDFPSKLAAVLPYLAPSTER